MPSGSRLGAALLALIGAEAAAADAGWQVVAGHEAYHSACHVCHGPDGTGAAEGPALLAPLAAMSRFDFVDLVRNGSVRETGGTTRVMPAFGTNPQVMCRADAIYDYLRARAAGTLPPGRPEAAPVPASAQAALRDCLGE